jgi:hypothetical protein
MRHTHFARRILTAAAALLLLLAPAAAQAQKQLKIVGTVTDPEGKPFETLAPGDVRVTEDGVAATVVKVEAITRVPKLHLLVDAGVGLPGEALADLRRGLRELIAAIPDGVQISLVSTAPQPRFIERGTTDKAKALKAIDLLAPDSGAGRFVESLYELSERIEKDKDSTNVVVSVATTSGDLNIRDGDIKKIMSRTGRMRVFVVLFNRGANTSASGGQTQMDVGDMVAKGSGGRYEMINVASRLATLLPEIGAEAGKMMGQGAKQFRATVDRPGGKTGELGKVGIAVVGKMVAGVLIEN